MVSFESLVRGAGWVVSSTVGDGQKFSGQMFRRTVGRGQKTFGQIFCHTVGHRQKSFEQIFVARRNYSKLLELSYKIT